VNFIPAFLAIILAWPVLVPLGFRPGDAQESPAVLSGFEPAEIFEAEDGGPLGTDSPILTRLLLRCLQVSDASFIRAARHTKSVSLKDCTANPRDFRFYSFAISGTATEFHSYPLNHEDSLLVGFHLVHVNDATGTECLVAIPEPRDQRHRGALPDRWVPRESLDQPVRFFGFFMGLRRLANDEGSVSAPSALQNKLRAPVFVARKLSWYPDRALEKYGIDENDVLLARAGVDFHQLRHVGRNGSYGIDADEALSFYQLLLAASQLDHPMPVTRYIQLEEMLRSPRACLAKPVRLTGDVRRITEVTVADDHIRRTLGIEKYYQIDMFITLDNRKIVIQPPGKSRGGQPVADGQATGDLVFEHRFPVTICTVSLPMEPERIHRKRITVRGFFFKNWSYQSERSIASRSGVQQIAPLILAGEPAIAPSIPDYFGWGVTAFALCVLSATLLLAWSMRLGKSVDRQRSIPEKFELPVIDE